MTVRFLGPRHRVDGADRSRHDVRAVSPPRHAVRPVNRSTLFVAITTDHRLLLDSGVYLLLDSGDLLAVDNGGV